MDICQIGHGQNNRPEGCNGRPVAHKVGHGARQKTDPYGKGVTLCNEIRQKSHKGIGKPQGAPRELKPHAHGAGRGVQPHHIQRHAFLNIVPGNDPTQEHGHHGIEGRPSQAGMFPQNNPAGHQADQNDGHHRFPAPEFGHPGHFRLDDLAGIHVRDLEMALATNIHIGPDDDTHKGHKGHAVLHPGQKGDGFAVFHEITHHNGVSSSGCRGTRAPVIGGETDTQQQKGGQSAIFLNTVNLAGDLINTHQYGYEQRNEGMFRQKACRHGQKRNKDKGKGLGAFNMAQKDQADSLIQAGLCNPHGHHKDTEDEEYGILHISPGYLVYGKDIKQVHHHTHQDIGRPQWEGLGCPEKNRQEENGKHHLGHLRSLSVRHQGFTPMMDRLLIRCLRGLEGIWAKLQVDRVRNASATWGQFIACRIGLADQGNQALWRGNNHHAYED